MLVMSSKLFPTILERIKDAEQAIERAEEFQQVCDDWYKANRVDKTVIQAETEKQESNDSKPRKYKVGDTYPDRKKLTPI